MDITRLKLEQSFKSYKALCLYIDEPVKAGKAKILQLKDWSRYFSFEKEGNTIYISKIEDKPMVKVDRRSEGNNGKYINQASSRLLDFLALNSTNDFEDGSVYLTKQDIAEILGLCNEDYKWGKSTNYISSYSKQEDIPEDEHNDFFYRSGSALSSIITRVLKRLEDSKLITKQDTFQILYTGQTKYKVLRPNNLADELIIKDIRNIQAIVLMEMGMESMQEVFHKRKHIFYYPEVKKRVKAELGIHTFFQVIRISFHDSIATRAEQFKVASGIALTTQTYLNDLFAKGRHKEIVTRVTKAIKRLNEIGSGSVPQREDEYLPRINSKTITNNDKLIEHYIKLPNDTI